MKINIIGNTHTHIILDYEDKNCNGDFDDDSDEDDDEYTQHLLYLDTF